MINESCSPLKNDILIACSGKIDRPLFPIQNSILNKILKHEDINDLYARNTTKKNSMNECHEVK